jgi:hypothetical protein
MRLDFMGRDINEAEGVPMIGSLEIRLGLADAGPAGWSGPLLGGSEVGEGPDLGAPGQDGGGDEQHDQSEKD